MPPYASVRVVPETVAVGGVTGGDAAADALAEGCAAGAALALGAAVGSAVGGVDPPHAPTATTQRERAARRSIMTYVYEGTGENFHVARVIRKNEDLLGLPSVRVIAATGDMLGVMPTADALRLAREQGLDLVEVNPKATPPVCKMLDLGKYSYDEARKAGETPRHKTLVFLVRSKIVVRNRPGAFLVGEIVTGDAIRAGMVARIPAGPDVLHDVPIVGVELADHVATKTSEIALHVAGDAAIDALVGPQLVEIIESRAPHPA